LGLVGSLAQACTLRAAQLEHPVGLEAPGQAPTRALEDDLLPLMARRAGCRVEWRWFSLRGAWLALERGAIDVIPGVVLTPERERLAHVVPLLAVPTVLVVPEGLAPAPTPDAMLASPQGRVLRLRGGAYAPAVQAWLDALAAQGRLDEVGDYPAAMRLLRAGRAQALPLSAAMLPRESIPGLRVVEAWPEASVWAGFGLSRTTLDDAQRHQLQEALHGLVRDGTLLALVRQRYGEAGSRRLRPASPSP
jgi:polar amino acid transport system substrate-binding protein